MQCLNVAENIAKCPLTRDVRLREVSVGGGLTYTFHIDELVKVIWGGINLNIPPT